MPETSHRSRVLPARSVVTAAPLPALLLWATVAGAGLIQGTNRDDVLFGRDDDNMANAVIQPAGAVDQSLADTDVFEGGRGHDVVIGLKGSDVMRGGPGQDVLVGGTEGARPNSDIMFGDEQDDVSLWRAGDGSEAFIGGNGLDAQVFGAIDRDANNVPILSPVKGPHRNTGLPTADVTGQGGFCTLEDVRGSDLGYEFLVRFFVRATGALAVTVRLAEVEQVFCTSVAGGAITFADLTAGTPAFAEVSLDEVAKLNRTVAAIIR
jgi:hypothetical protein